jgi:hypothetical protein
VIGEGELAPGPFLAASVGHVVGVAVEKEVIGIDASPLVATMADIRARRDWPVLQAPGQAMRALRAVVDAERAVAAVGDGALPEMTAGDRIDLRVVGQPALEGPAWPAMNAWFLLHAAHFTRRVVDHLLWALAREKCPQTRPIRRGQCPFEFLRIDTLSSPAQRSLQSVWRERGRALPEDYFGGAFGLNFWTRFPLSTSPV